MKQNNSHLLGYPQKHSSPKLPSLPLLPKHLDELLDSPWNHEASKLVDCWLAYVAAEFEGVQS